MDNHVLQNAFVPSGAPPTLEEISDLPVLQAQEQIVAVVNVSPQGRLFVRLTHVPQRVEEFTEDKVFEPFQRVQCLFVAVVNFPPT